MKRVYPFLIACFAALLVPACASQPQKKTLDGNDTLILYNQSMDAYAKGDLITAEQGLKEVLNRVPHDEQVWFRLANIYAQTNRPRLAINAYQETLVRNSDMVKAWHNMGVVRLRQAANDFMSLANSLPPGDPLRQRGVDISKSIMVLLGELPDTQRPDDAISLKKTQKAPVKDADPSDSNTDPAEEEFDS